MKGSQGSADLSVIMPAAGSVTLLTMIYCSEVAFFLREENTIFCGVNVAPDTLDIEVKVLVDLNEVCGSIVQTCLTRRSKTKNFKDGIGIVNWLVSF